MKHLVISALLFIASMAQASPIHPTVIWRDAQGTATKDTISFEASCGTCHDISYIKSHDTHEKLYGNAGFNCLTCHSTPKAERSESWSFTEATLTRPRTANCQQCHEDNSLYAQMSGRIFSGQHKSESNFNLENKNSLNHAWDIHAERGLACSDCHFSTNNPVYLRKDGATKQKHLTFDPRRPDIGVFLKQPSHNLAFQEGTSYDCTYCHTGEHAGIWKDRSDIHFKKLACQSCHTPELQAPVLKSVDRTVLSPEGEILKRYQNVSDDGVITPFRPKLFKSHKTDKFTPFNKVFERYFFSAKEDERIPDSIISEVFKENSADIATYLDRNKNGTIEKSERDSASGNFYDFMKIKLLEKGHEGVIIKELYHFEKIAHNTVRGAHATKNCTQCHSAENTFSTEVATAEPVQVISSFGCDESGLYIFGQECTSTITYIGIGTILMVLMGIFLHTTARIVMSFKHKNNHHFPTKKVYIYRVYERIWHWTQALVILILIATGLVIHNPTAITIISFDTAILIHRVLGIILGLNALLALFYNVTTGKIQQYIPEPRGFFSKAFAQQKYYLKGIFFKERHPFQKVPEQRLNPLQQIAYMGLLNILLPILVITGFIIFFYPYDSTLLQAVGGLEMIASIHALCSWLMISFLIMHIYLTTTGHTVTDYTKAMITGWEDIEDHSPELPSDAHPTKEHKNDQ